MIKSFIVILPMSIVITFFIPNNSLSLLISPARNFIDFDGFFKGSVLFFRISLIFVFYFVDSWPYYYYVQFCFVLLSFSAFLRWEFRSLILDFQFYVLTEINFLIIIIILVEFNNFNYMLHLNFYSICNFSNPPCYVSSEYYII